MLTENLYQPFEVSYQELTESPVSAHKHTFFELVYILDGTGRQCINQNTFDYHSGHLFLLTPEDCHSFQVSSTTRFFFVRFQEVYLSGGYKSDDWVRRIEFIFLNATHTPGCILHNQSDKALMRALMDGLMKEYVNQELYHREVITQIIHTVLMIVARNLALKLPEKIQKQSAETTILQIIRHIQSGIYQPESLRAEQIASRFGLSVNYLSEYFKKHTGETLQQYIIGYKMKLVEARLLHSDLRINEIADELQFTDESHLNRLFRKYRGMSPTEFRKKRA